TDLTTQLDEVQSALGKLPPGTDLTLLTSLESAYSERLRALTSDFVQVQDSQLAPGPVSRLGDASEPLTTTSLKKILGIGVAVGLALAAALALLLDFLR